MSLAERIRPIHSEQQYEAYLNEIDHLLTDLTVEAQERLEVLAILVEAYEEEQFPIPPPDPIEALEFYMDQKGLKPRDLEQYIGTRARVSEILGGKRALSIGMIRRLHEGLGIPADLLIQRRTGAPHPARTGTTGTKRKATTA